MDSTVHGIIQARILSGYLFLSPGDLPNPGIKPRSPALQADSLPAEVQGKPSNSGYLVSISPGDNKPRHTVCCMIVFMNEIFMKAFWPDLHQF